MEGFDFDGHGANLDPIEDWHALDDVALAGALIARGVTDGVLDRIIDHRDDDLVDRILDRYFGENP